MPASDLTSLFTLPKCCQGNLGFVLGQVHTAVHKLYLWSDPAENQGLCWVSTGSPGYIVGKCHLPWELLNFILGTTPCITTVTRWKQHKHNLVLFPQCCENQRFLGCSVLAYRKPVSGCFVIVQLPNLNSLQSSSLRFLKSYKGKNIFMGINWCVVHDLSIKLYLYSINEEIWEDRKMYVVLLLITQSYALPFSLSLSLIFKLLKPVTILKFYKFQNCN